MPIVNIKKLAFLILLFFLISVCQLKAQVDTTNWTSHFSYTEFVDVASSNEKVYVASLNSVFSYNLDSNEVIEYTTIEGLSGDEISVLFYSETHNSLIIGYENGLIEIVNESTGEISSFVDVQQQNNIITTSQTINNFFEDEDILYIATGFGVVSFDITTGFFGDTFFISDSQANLSNVLAVGVFENLLVASIEGRGTFVANKNLGALLLDFSSWSNIQEEVFLNILKLENEIVAYNGTTELYSFQGSIFENVYMNSENISNLKINEDNITITGSTSSVILNQNFIENSSFQHGENINLVRNSVFIDNELFYDIEGDGFFKTVNQSTDNSSKISPEGPVHNNAYKLDIFNGQLWIAYGNSNITFNDFAGSTSGLRSADIDHYNSVEKSWENIPFEEFDVRSLQNVVINKVNPNEIYFSSYRGGLLRYDGSNFTLFDETNSNLEKDEQVFVGFSESLTETLELSKVYFTAFDGNNNIWVVNSRQKNIIKQFSEDNSGVSHDFESILSIPEGRFDFYNFEEFLFDRLDEVIYIASRRNGLIGYEFSSRNSIEISNVDVQNMPSINVKSLALDKNGELWIGTVFGIRKITNPQSMFQNGNIQAESIIFEQDGIARELLFEQIIWDIKVDDNNNKWIATNDGGVFYVSEDGQETIFNFTTDNSPLPSNTVVDIAIDESTGAVYFATEKGLMEFNSNITSAAEDLSAFKVFPNPVRPEYGEVNVTIQGLTAGANVKITDVEGNLVYEMQNETFDNGGSGTVIWDTKTFSGNKVASGVYLLLITGEDALETKVEKLLIVR